MNYFDNANEYIKEKLKENNVNQKDFSENILKMSQSNFSTALNQKNSRHFTLEQYISIADYFQISLDTLFGRETAASQISPRSICSWLMELFKSKRAICKTISLDEQDARKSYSTYPESTEYQALIFPNFDNNSKKFSEHETMRFLASDYRGYDNSDYDNIAINKFIKKFQDIHDFYIKKGMPEEAYDIVINTYLRELSTNSYCSPQDFRQPVLGFPETDSED